MYTPLTESVYVAAFTSAFAGMTASGRTLENVTPATYSAFASIAGAWARAFDQEWGFSETPPTDVQLAAISSFCEAAWQGRSPPNTAAANNFLTYTNQVLAIQAAISGADTWLAANVVL
jgi:hypothetical protein